MSRACATYSARGFLAAEQKAFGQHENARSLELVRRENQGLAFLQVPKKAQQAATAEDKIQGAPPERRGRR